MRLRPVLNGVALAMLLSGCTTNVLEPASFSFQGQSSYQLNAADVFRLSKQLKQRDLVKTLKPLYGKRYYTEGEFQSAILRQFTRVLDDEIYGKLKQNALVDPESLFVEFLSDNTLRIRFGDRQVPAKQQLLNLSSLNASSLKQVNDTQWMTNKLRIGVDPKTLCVSLSDIDGNGVNQVCPTESPGFSLNTDSDYQYHGLGQEFQSPGNLDGRWNQRTRHAGNKMEGFNGGATGNTIIPVLYAASATNKDFALYMNNLYSSEWSFNDRNVEVTASKGVSEVIVMTAPDQKTLREQFMQMAGKPLVPPRKMFGLWLSEYGFDNWREMDNKLSTLAENQFPLDGVVMDLQWFGNVIGNDPDSQMGTLTWDRDNFPNPERKIAQLKQQGIGMVLIEESYVSQGLNEFKDLEKRGFLATDPETGLASNVNPHGGGSWWGKGGMIDWSNPDVSAYWHDWKRQPLVDMGVMGHWTDLGEPEMYNHKARYFNDQPHDEIHNLFNYYWLEGIYEGYKANQVKARPFMMSRSGTTGIQKFGASMWSADIGSNLTSLATHIGQQTNMMLSGIDYYGSDIGGFHRKGLGVIGDEKPAVLNETYTQWFAYSSLFDVPVRPHTENLCNCKETAPDRVGDLLSNRNNLALRYELIPYMYSLAHMAHRQGKAVFTPLSYEFDNDAVTYDVDNQKMIGEGLMSAVVAKLGAKSVDVYFPKGEWFDFRTGLPVRGDENRVYRAALYNNENRFQLPLYARDGAIIPVAKGDGGNWTSDVPENLTLKVFGLASNEFTVFEDDGETTAYLKGALRQTSVKVDAFEYSARLTVSTTGGYQGMPQQRALELNWYLENDVQVKQVVNNGDQEVTWSQTGNQLTVSLEHLLQDTDTKLTIHF